MNSNSLLTSDETEKMFCKRVLFFLLAVTIDYFFPSILIKIAAFYSGISALLYYWISNQIRRYEDYVKQSTDASKKDEHGEDDPGP